MKPQYFLLLLMTLLIFNSCELLDELEEEEEEVFVELPLSVSWTYVGSNGAYSAPYYEFNGAYWNEGKIRFDNSSLENGIEWVSMKDLNITGVGSYPLLYSPSGYLKLASHVYSTTVYPAFWVEGMNNGTLVEGGAGYTPSAYAGSGIVAQGGYVNITEYSQYYISGNFYFVAWVFDNQLNREISVGIIGSFENVLYAD